MPTAKKLPSGSWRCQVFSHKEERVQSDGTIKQKNIYKSFTVSDPTPKGKRKCEAMAADWAEKKELKSHNSITFEEAINMYIEERKNVLSARTAREYKMTANKHFAYLKPLEIDKITREDIQKQINLEAVSLSPKTVRNLHGLISAVMGVYRPDFAIRTQLPKKVQSNLHIPTDSEIQRLIAVSRGTEMEIPILLAAIGTMRRGEIAALKVEDIKGNIAHISKNMVRVDKGTWIIKAPKSYAGDRFVELPDFVIQKLPPFGHVTDLRPDQITNRFIRLLKKNDLSHFRFHDLRHYSASIQHAIGIPDSYIMQRGGWGNDGTLKQVYRHALSDKEHEMNQRTNDYFSSLYHTAYHTK